MRTPAVAAALVLAIISQAPAEDPPKPPQPAVATPQAKPEEAAGPVGVEALQQEADRIRPLLKSDLARSLLAPVPGLPRIEPRKLYVNKETRTWYTPAERDALPEADRAKLTEVTRDEQFYYTTRYGTPLAYTRPLDLLHERAPAAMNSLADAHILDYGYGTIGQLRLMAMNGAHVIGMDNDSALAKLYSAPGDTGEVAAWKAPPAPGAPANRLRRAPGDITLCTGRFPVDPGCTPADIRKLAPDGLDLFISKNTLKNGYIHPAQPVDKRLLVDLGTTEEAFLIAVRDTLKQGGCFLIYNLSPAPSKPGEPYKHWADGHCPFTKQQLEAAGFEVIVYDENDDKAAREMARALGWDKDGMDVENDLFAHWTLARRTDKPTMTK